MAPAAGVPMAGCIDKCKLCLFEGAPPRQGLSGTAAQLTVWPSSASLGQRANPARETHGFATRTLTGLQPHPNNGVSPINRRIQRGAKDIEESQILHE